LAAFVQSIDPANALTAITAAREEMFFTNLVDYRIPATFKNIAGYAAAANDASVSRAQIQSPSLRLQSNLDVEPILQAPDFGAGLLAVSMFGDNPVELVEDEAMNFAFLSDPAAAAIHAGLVFLADGPLTPVSGKVFTVRCTATIAQAAAAWVNGNLTFQQVLPAGDYAVVGARFRSADMIAARLVFPAQVARPGFAGGNAFTDVDHPAARFGALGVWGQFPNTIPPTLDVIGGAAAAQVVYLDLIRVS
jgi:hypothetical protein